MKQPKVRKALYLTKGQYWCIQYIRAVTNKNNSQIVEAALKYAVKYIGKGKTKPRKPKLPLTRIRLDLHITRDTALSIESLRVQRDMLDWSTNDFGRYGVQHILCDYMTRFPEMGKIIRRYDGN